MSKLAEKTPEGAPVEDASTTAEAPWVPRWQRLSGEQRVLAGMICGSVVLWTIVGFLGSLPLLYPDEFLYQGLAESLANGDGLTIRGAGQDLISFLYILGVAPAWLVASGEEAYAFARTLNAVYMSLAAVPVWLLARELTDGRRALIPTGLVLVGPWMLLTNEIVTENLAFPLATASLAAMVMALRTPGSRWWLAAGAFALGATLSRTHLGALAGVLLVLPLLDPLRMPAGLRRERLRAHRAWLWAMVAMVAVAALAIAASDLGVLGRYQALRNVHASFGGALGWSLDHALALAVTVGFVPLVVVVALGSRRDNWRSDDVGPLLLVTLVSAVTLLGLAGWFVDGGVEWLIERYVIYLAPLLLIGLVLAPRRVGWRGGAAASAGLAGLLLLLPEALQFAEGNAVVASRRLGGALGGPFAEHPEIAVAGFALVLCATATWLLVRVPRVLPAPPARPKPKGKASVRAAPPPPRVVRIARALAVPVVGTSAITLVALTLTTGRAVELRGDHYDTSRGGLPGDLEWVDRAADGRRVAFLAFERRTSEINEVTEFYNSVIDSAYRLPGVEMKRVGPYCTATVGRDGALGTRPPCDPLPRDLVFEDGAVRARLHGETKRVAQVFAGTYARTSEPRPRLMSLVAPPCSTLLNACTGQIRALMWLDRPAKVEMTFNVGSQPGTVTIPSGEEFNLEANTRSRITLDVPAGRQGVIAPVSWTDFSGPELESVELEDSTGRVTLY